MSFESIHLYLKMMRMVQEKHYLYTLPYGFIIDKILLNKVIPHTDYDYLLLQIYRIHYIRQFD